MTIIKDSTFSDTTDLEQVYVPDSVETIENNAFSVCINLKYVRLSE